MSTAHLIGDFNSDGVFRDEEGVIWVRQSEMIAGMARAWDEARNAAEARVATP